MKKTTVYLFFALLLCGVAQAATIYETDFDSLAGWTTDSGVQNIVSFGGRSVLNDSSGALYTNLSVYIGNANFTQWKIKGTTYLQGTSNVGQALAAFYDFPPSSTSQNGYAGDVFENPGDTFNSRIIEYTNGASGVLTSSTDPWPINTWLNITLTRTGSSFRYEVVDESSGTVYSNITTTDASPFDGHLELLVIGNGDSQDGTVFWDNIEISSLEHSPDNNIISAAYAAYTGDAIVPVTFSIYNGSGTSDFLERVTNTTANLAYFNYTPGTYTLVTNASGYISNTVTFTFTTNYFTAITLYPDNRLEGEFRNEETGALIGNVSYDLISDVYSGSFNTTNGSFLLAGIPPGDYEIRYGLNTDDPEFNPWTARSYFFRVPLSSSGTNLTLRLLNESLASAFIRIIQDSNANPLGGSFLEIQRFYPDQGGWFAVERANIDNEGDAVFTAIPTTSTQSQAYRFRVYTNFSLIYTGEPLYLVDTTKTIRIPTEGDLLQNFNSWRNIQSTITYLNASDPLNPGSFELVYSGASIPSQICLNVTRSYFQNVTVVNSTCSSQDDATLVAHIDSDLNGTYIALAYATYPEGTYVFDQLEENIGSFQLSEILGAISWVLFVAAMFIALLVMLYSGNIIVGLMIACGSLLAFSTRILGLVEISIISVTGVIVVGVIIIYLSERK